MRKPPDPFPAPFALARFAGRFVSCRPEGLVSQSPKRRRRWPWFVLLAVLVVAGGPIASRLRPLTATEQALLGSWRPQLGFSPQEFAFTSDRRFTHKFQGQVVFTGSWQADGDELSIWADEPPTWRTLVRVIRGDPRDRYSGIHRVHFSLPDQIGFIDIEIDDRYEPGAFIHDWQRVPD